MTKFNIGDKISALDEAMDGVVLSVNGNNITIETTDGFELIFDIKALIKTQKGVMNFNIQNLIRVNEIFPSFNCR